MKELINIQQKLKAPKNQKNHFGKYNYRSCEDILEAVKPILQENQCILIMTDDIVCCGDRIYIKATATVINKDGKKIENTALAREPLTQKGMSDPQVTGSASSYARKYALNGLFAIDDTTDNDSQDNSVETAINTINKLLKETKTDTMDFLKYFKVSAVSQLTYEAQQKAIKMLTEKKNKRSK